METLELLELLEEKDLHVHVLTEEDAGVVYANNRKVHPGRMPGYNDTHYVMDNQGQVTYIGWKEGILAHAYSYKSDKEVKNAG